jgi:putative transposase
MNRLKSLTARALFDEFPRLRQAQWGGQLWADGYYVASSGERVTSDLVQRYIRYQKAEAQSPRQLSLFDRPQVRRSRTKPR